MYYKEQLISIRESLSDLLSDLKREMETLPEGFYILYNPAAGEAFAGMTDDYTIPEE